MKRFLWYGLAVLAVAACFVIHALVHRALVRADAAKIVALPFSPPVPAAYERAGGVFFRSPRLAPSRRTCSTCHPLNRGGSDGLEHGGTRTLPICDLGVQSVFFRDGSCTNLERAVERMLAEEAFLGAGSCGQAVRRLAADASAVRLLGTNDLVRVIAGYVLTRTAGKGPFDRFRRGAEDALSAGQRAGFDVFRDRRCVRCHAGAAMGGTGVSRGRLVPPLRGLMYRGWDERILDAMRVPAAESEEGRALREFLGVL